ncbi:nucleoid-associated protein [Lactococcus muris]
MKPSAGKIYTAESGALTEEIQKFFNKHVKDILESKRTRNSRFKKIDSPFLQYFEGIFDSYDKFDQKSKLLNTRFYNKLAQAQKKDFLLIIFDSSYEGEKCLGVLTMEAKKGLQLSGDILSIINDLLPDSGAKLKKAAIVFERESLTFKKEQETTVGDDEMSIRHAVVIDRQTPDITNHFMDFLNSEIIPDKPTEVTKILLRAFPKVLSKYLLPDFKKKDIQNEIRNMFSTRRDSNFDSITHTLKTKFLSEDKLEKDSIDVDDLSLQVFREAKKQSSAITYSFTAESSRFSKNIIKDLKGGKNINLVISEKSIEEGDVKIKNLEKKDEPYIIVEVKRDAIKLEKTI